MSGMQKVTGGCHCGAVRYEAEVDLDKTMQCNCSHCSTKGFVLTFAPEKAFKLVSGGDKLKEYRFYKHAIAHQFCLECGVQPFAYGKDPKGNAMVAINLRAADGVDLATLNPQKVDGRSF
ncbi:MAG: GFA family protein [Parvibaculaceae bacterium]